MFSNLKIPTKTFAKFFGRKPSRRVTHLSWKFGDNLQPHMWENARECVPALTIMWGNSAVKENRKAPVRKQNGRHRKKKT